MSKKVIKPFTFNDETVANTYGFYILTEGIGLTRFEKNPVMLSDHWNNNSYVLGMWTDWKKEGTLLTGLPDFDIEDENAAKIAGKVERGYLKGCSMGIIIDRENLSYIDGKIFLTKCELAEVSIVPIPSNANAVRLMNANGETLKEEEIQSLCLSVKNEAENPEFNLNIDNMKKITLSVAAFIALGFDTKAYPKDGIEESELEVKIQELAGKVTTLTKENEALESAAKTMKEAQQAAVKLASTQKVELAITQGKLPADKKEAFIQLGITSPEVLDSTLEAIPAKQNFSADIKNPTNTSDVKTPEDFQKLSADAQLAFKNDSPEEYKKIVELIK